MDNNQEERSSSYEQSDYYYSTREYSDQTVFVLATWKEKPQKHYKIEALPQITAEQLKTVISIELEKDITFQGLSQLTIYNLQHESDQRFVDDVIYIQEEIVSEIVLQGNAFIFEVRSLDIWIGIDMYCQAYKIKAYFEMLFKLDLALSELAYIVRKNIKELLHQYDENLQELQIVLQVRKNNFLSAQTQSYNKTLLEDIKGTVQQSFTYLENTIALSVKIENANSQRESWRSSLASPDSSSILSRITGTAPVRFLKVKSNCEDIIQSFDCRERLPSRDNYACKCIIQ